MTRKQAVAILEQEAWLEPDGSLIGYNPFLDYFKGEKKIQFDGVFTMKQLEAIVVYMRGHSK